MGGSFSLALRTVCIALGAFALAWHPSPGWIESAYANGFYPRWEYVIHPLTQALPWSLGDVAALGGMALIVWRTLVRLRSGGPLIRRAANALVDVLAIVAVYAGWFEGSWGWNYLRAPLESRVAYDTTRVTRSSLLELRSQTIAQLNALAPIAHARAEQAFDLETLRASWEPVVQAFGDTWTPEVGAPKPTLADPFMTANGTSGFINPLTLNVHLASDVLWFERPFDLAHEWSHVAAYAREDEANYLAFVTCTRSPDPVQRYSGWLELFLYLPPSKHYSRSLFVPQVWSDFAAIRARNARHINLAFATWSWRTYNVYLKSNRIASGVENYNDVTRLALGIPRDPATGLPFAHPDTHATEP